MRQVVLPRRHGLAASRPRHETAAVLRRLSPSRIVVLGGEAAVSAQVQAQLSTFVE